MRRETHLAIAAFAGFILGIAGSTVLASLGWVNLVPWAIAGMLIGVLPNQRHDALRPGLLYGFVLTVIFMLVGYKGSWTNGQEVGLLLLSLVLGLIGSIAGAILSLLGNKLRLLIQR